MKYRLSLIILLLISLPNFGQVISTDSKHNLVVWASGGYGSIMNDAADASAVGGGAVSLCAGYELHWQHFMLQLGAELSYTNSRMNRVDTLITQPLVDSQGSPYTSLSTLRNSYSLQSLINAAVPVMVGYKMDNGFYGLMGAKFLVNLVGSSNTYTTVTTEAQYPNIIGNNNGVIGNMPNHGLDTQTRNTKNTFILNPGFAVSLELGMPINFNSRSYIKKGTTVFRLALFCDYAMYTFNTAYKANTLLLNTSTTTAYLPALNGFLFHNTTTSTINTFVAGVKLTAVFGKKSSTCRCEHQ